MKSASVSTVFRLLAVLSLSAISTAALGGGADRVDAAIRAT
jgi:hypothetical protein